MLWVMEVGKRTGVWGTMAMRERRAGVSRVRISRPPIVRDGGSEVERLGE